VSAAARILVVDDEPDMVESCVFFLERAGYQTRSASSGAAALQLLEQERFALVISDVRMPRMSGLQLLGEIKTRDPDIEVLLITGYPEIEAAVAAIKQGAFDYLTKPYVEKELMERVEKALRHRAMKEQNAGFKERLRSGIAGRQLIYRSRAFGAVVSMLERAARSDAPVLILGESGTGKELLAHHLHDRSTRAGRPFVPVDCATVPAELFESELFGHRKGAFTGAAQNRVGLFQVADGGTLFFDELGELPLPFQPKLLRALQEKSIRPVGSTEQVAVSVRIVAATNRDLQQEVDDGRFRQELFYRLDVVRIVVPPLRERLEDVDGLAQHFLSRLGAGAGIDTLSAEAAAALQSFHWPGNVRQLRNVIERACALGHGPELRLEDLPEEVRSGLASTPDAGDGAAGSFQAMKTRKIAALENAYLQGLLKKHNGNVTHCAEEAGMTRSALQKLMQKHGIKSGDFRE